MSVASLIKHLDHDEIESLSSVAAKIADQEPTVESGDDILRALSPLLARYKSLHLGRQLAEQIVSVDGKLETFTALLDVYLSRGSPPTSITDEKLPKTLVMNTALPDFNGPRAN